MSILKAKSMVNKENPGGDIEKDKVPVFVVPLAKTLAIAESQSDKSLTEEEVLKIRDTAPCMMIPREKLKEFHAAQGYQDIDPLNVWFEWNRVKYEDFGAGSLPALTLSILCNRNKVSGIRKILKEADISSEILPPNQQLAGDVINARSKLAAMDDLQPEKIVQHSAVVSARSKCFRSQSAAQNSSGMMRLFPSIIDAGALEIFCESSYICHANAIWRSLAARTTHESMSSNLAEFWQAMYLAFVQHPVRFEDDFISCGMHLLGKPDLLIQVDTAQKFFASDNLASVTDSTRELMSDLALYLLVSCTDGSFVTGSTFSTKSDSPKLRAVWQQCDVFPMEDPRFNYLGYWRLEIA